MGRTVQRLFGIFAALVLLAAMLPWGMSDVGDPDSNLSSAVVPSRPALPKATSFSPVTFDDFTRTVSSGWGTSTTGVAWTDDSLRQNGVTSQQAGNAMSVDGLNGRMDLGITNPVFMRAGTGPWQNAEWTMTARFKVSVVPGTGAQLSLGFWVFTDAPLPYGDGPHVEMFVSSDSARGLVLLDGTTGDPNRVSITKTDWLANTLYSVKWGLTWGGQSKVKVWPTSDAEPATWLLIRDGSHDRVTTGASTVLEPEAEGTLTANTVAWFDDIHFDPANLYVDPPPPSTQNQEDGATSKDPVQTFSGAILYRHTDVSIVGRGPRLDITRSYNSGDTRVSRLGPGWTDSYNVRLADPGDGTPDLILERPDGSTTRYVANGSTFVASPGQFGTLVRNADSSYTVTNRDLTVWTFDPSGRFLSIADRYGNVSSLSYDAHNQLASISDPAGRGVLTLGYANGYLTSVSDWSSPPRTVGYQYDASGRLWKVTDRENKVTTFAYDGSSARLSSITDARTDVDLTITYDAQGRVATQKDAKGLTTGDATTFAYTINGDGTRVTTVTEPVTSFEPTFHPTTTDTYDVNGRLTSRVSRPSSTETLTETYAYDAIGDRTSVTDARGNRTDFCYDVNYAGATIAGSRGNLTRRIDPPPTPGANRPVTLISYDAKNNVIQRVAPKGVASGTTETCSTDRSAFTTAYATDFGYDAASVKLLSETSRFTDPDMGLKTAITKYEYGDSANPGLVTRVIPPRGNTTGTPDYTYATTLTYFASGPKAGLLSTVANALGDTTAYDYDAVGRLTSRVDPLGNQAIGGWGPYHTTAFTYDKEDRVLTQSVPPALFEGAALITQTRYDEVGNATVRIDESGQVTTFAYDERDALFQVKEAPTTWTDPAAPPSSVITTEYAYDAAGNRTRMTRAKGDSANERVTDYAFDGRGLARMETQYPSWPATSPTLVTAGTYDADGNVLSLVDPLGNTTTDGYDALNRLTSIGYSDGVTPNVSYGYDANGNRTSMGDGTGASSYAFDEANRMTSTTTPGPKTVSYRYDLDGNRTKVIYPDLTAVTYTFNKASQLGSLQDWAARSIGYTYWPDGLVKTVTNPDATIANYAYDNTRRLIDIAHTGPTGQSLDRSFYTVDKTGNVTAVNHGLLGPQVSRPDGFIGSNGSWTGTYASINEVTPNDSTILASPSGPTSANYYEVSLSDVLPPMDLTNIKIHYRIAKSGNNSGQTTGLVVDLRQGSTVVYGASYTSLPGASGSGWLDDTITVSQQRAPTITNFNDLRIRFTPSSSGGGQARKAQISWLEFDVPSPADPAQNTSYVYDRLNRLTSSTGPDGAPTYSYDPVGNRTSKVLSGTTNYTYDRADRMTAAGPLSVTVNASGNMTARGTDTFAYDQANRLKTATVAGSSETYVYDGSGLRFSRQVGAGTPMRYVSDPSRALPVTIDDGTRKYVYGLALAYAVSGTTVEVYHADRLGTIRAITANGSVVGTYRNDDWGNVLAQTGSSTQPYGFTGEARDATGLTYLRARYYDPSLGRFMSRDRLAGSQVHPQSLSRYIYAADNPLLYADPSGLKSNILQGPDLGVLVIGGGLLLIGGAACVLSGACELLAAGAATDVVVVGAVEIATPAADSVAADAQEVEAAAAAGTETAGALSKIITIAEHGARHLPEGISQGAAESAIRAQVQQIVSNSVATGSFWGRVTVNGITIEYRAYTLADGSINVGTYYPAQ